MQKATACGGFVDSAGEVTEFRVRAWRAENQKYCASWRGRLDPVDAVGVDGREGADGPEQHERAHSRQQRRAHHDSAPHPPLLRRASYERAVYVTTG